MCISQIAPFQSILPVEDRLKLEMRYKIQKIGEKRNSQVLLQKEDFQD